MIGSYIPMKPRQRTLITHEGLYYLLVLVLVFGGALARGVNLLLVLAGMLAGPLLLSRFMAVITLRGLSVRRRLPQGICAGDLLMANVVVTNTRRRLSSWAVVVEDPVRREPAGANGRRQRNPQTTEAAVLFPFVPAGEERKGVYRGRLMERGRYRMGPLRLSTRFPFGLFCHRIPLASATTLTVYPRLGRLTRGWIARHHQSFAGTDRRERRPGVDGDFFGVRPWRPGDSRRWIHWRTSARRGELVVRQFEQPRNRDVAVLLDLWQPEQPGPKHRDNLELAVSFAATVVAELCRKGGSDVYLGMVDPEPRISGGPASAVLQQNLMERLALVEGRSREATADLLEQALRQVEPGTEIVLIATRPTDLADTARFGGLWADPAGRRTLGQVRVIDTSNEELGQYFQIDWP
jgi:uncharacterized protein (DUF58 family)